MTSATKPIIIFMVLLHLQLQLQLFPLMASVATAEPVPVPATWPHQFHSVLFINSTGSLHKVDLWYDWPNGRNFNIIQYQLGELKYDLEWNNGTSFYYTLEPFNKTCKVMHFDVGILRPNWLDGANYLGQENVDNFLCNVWEKVDFILYYEDVLTHRPVKWIFLTSGMTAHVMTYEVGAVLEDPNWQAPAYCFGEDDIAENSRNSSSLLEPESAANGGFQGELMMRGMAHTADAK